MGEPLYWDPMPHLADARPPDGTFQGRWHERNWRNVPGPFYGASTDNCWVGRLHAPRHVLYGDDDDYEQEFLYRQPRNPAELYAVVTAADEDPMAGWACDGDAHWTPSLVREWWRDRGRLREWAGRKHREWHDAEHAARREAATGLADYLAYLDGELRDHLRAYMFFLDHRVSPAHPDRLPPL
ncbi:hypothetical protein KZZ52_34965 [Dactylosporangium sp. AC04546]|uniref:hypothetical protein n=1 Tax=Dactylosporangium sp. AC04546 TaxID=2862460 RepID=UPI001EE125BB|nr:hypothetical protein [Dactylosporangium sp. AC04546]WVK79172.1 hypothetical protein KZZ52_34965 [Dactylosporangium sp. AC04546]